MLVVIYCSFVVYILINLYPNEPCPMLIIRTDRVYNVSEALDLENISGHSKPYVFKIIREEGKGTIFWKKWSTDLVCVVIKATLFSCCIDILKITRKKL